MNINQLATLYTVDQLKNYVVYLNADLNEDYDLIIFALLTVLDPLMPIAEYVSFCDAL